MCDKPRTKRGGKLDAALLDSLRLAKEGLLVGLPSSTYMELRPFAMTYYDITRGNEQTIWLKGLFRIGRCFSERRRLKVH